MSDLKLAPLPQKVFIGLVAERFYHGNESCERLSCGYTSMARHVAREQGFQPCACVTIGRLQK